MDVRNSAHQTQITTYLTVCKNKGCSDFLRLSRLTLADALLHTWLIVTSAKLIDTPERFLVDRSDRKDLRIFQIGLRSIEAS